MTDCLVYWKFFWGDLQKYGLEGVDEHWHSRSASFFSQVKPGDDLWVVASGGPDHPEEWRLLQRIDIKELRFERSEDRPYHAVGDRGKSYLFNLNKQHDFTPLLKQLEFASGRRILENGRLIGRAIQAIRPLSASDKTLLENYADTLESKLLDQGIDPKFIMPEGGLPSPHPITMLNRMCWNTRGWRVPTYTSEEGGYPSQMGFGHEEWNFQVEDAVEGYVYGYLYYRPAEKAIRESGGHFKIYFWSLDPDTHKKLIVGTYADSTLVDDHDYSKLDDAFTERGIYQRRASELSAAVPSMTANRALREMTNAVRKKWLNFKCRVEDVHHLAEYVPMAEVFKRKNIGQYFARPTFVDDIELPAIPRRLSPRLQGTAHAQNIAALAEDGYYRESSKNLKFIVRRHNKLSNEFATWLRESGYLRIIQEQNQVG